MMRSPIIHPDVLRALAVAGHKSLIVIADAHFAGQTNRGRNAALVHAALAPGSPTVTETARLIGGLLTVEAVVAMRPPSPDLGVVAQEVARAFDCAEPDEVSREQFTALSRSDDTVLCVVTGDTRRFANVILRVGVTPAA
ncbi:RbsD/FucU domain-containing protein [Microbacterium sp. NPDC055683]